MQGIAFQGACYFDARVQSARPKMSSLPAGSTERRPVVAEDDEQSFQERVLALEQRERRVAEAEQLARNSGCRILMDGKMVPVFTPEAEATYDALLKPGMLQLPTIW